MYLLTTPTGRSGTGRAPARWRSPRRPWSCAGLAGEQDVQPLPRRACGRSPPPRTRRGPGTCAQISRSWASASSGSTMSSQAKRGSILCASAARPGPACARAAPEKLGHGWLELVQGGPLPRAQRRPRAPPGRRARSSNGVLDLAEVQPQRPASNSTSSGGNTTPDAPSAAVQAAGAARDRAPGSAAAVRLGGPIALWSQGRSRRGSPRRCGRSACRRSSATRQPARLSQARRCDRGRVSRRGSAHRGSSAQRRRRVGLRGDQAVQIDRQQPRLKGGGEPLGDA